MSVTEAVAYMQKSVSVQDWNERRTHVFNNMETDFKWYVEAIDSPDSEGVGLIIKTLGKDGENEKEV